MTVSDGKVILEITNPALCVLQVRKLRPTEEVWLCIYSHTDS